MEFGERLAKLIDEKGITAYKLSKETGITQSTLSEVLNAKNKTLSTPNTIKVANCLGVSTDYLLGKSPFKSTSEAKYSIIVATMKMILI